MNRPALSRRTLLLAGMLSLLLAGCALKGADATLTSADATRAAPPAPAPTATPTPPGATASPAPTAALPNASATPSPTTPAPAGSAWQNTALGPLTLAEYRVVDEKTDTPDHFEFNQRIPPDVFALRSAQRDWWLNLQGQVDAANAVLQRFGWKVSVGPVTAPSPRASYLELFHNGTREMQLNFMRPIAVSESGANFALLVEELNGKSSQWLLTKDGLAPWDASLHAYVTSPVFVGELMVTAGHENNWDVATVWAGPQTFHIPAGAGASPVSSPIKGFWAYQGQWLLELQGELVVNGKGMNADLGCEEIFSWQLLGGKPFYFCRAGGKVSPVYDGKPLPLQYAEVIHYRCCEPAAFNAGGNARMLWFYARRDGAWYYVELFVN